MKIVLQITTINREVRIIERLELNKRNFEYVFHYYQNILLVFKIMTLAITVYTLYIHFFNILKIFSTAKILFYDSLYNFFINRYTIFL